jgi:hypothetical protein
MAIRVSEGHRPSLQTRGLDVRGESVGAPPGRCDPRVRVGHRPLVRNRESKAGRCPTHKIDDQPRAVPFKSEAKSPNPTRAVPPPKG